MKKGLIFNIQRFSTEDGPGIRTTVFMKGCPLRCIWCHNPEGLNSYPEIMWYESKCIGCGECVRSCPNKAIIATSKGLITEREKCQSCGKCTEVCPSGAREMVGRFFTVEEVVRDVKKDKIFYDKSGGGVTISGGEPCLQWEFIRDLLRECKNIGIHTALDTSGYVKWEILSKILVFSDLVLYDLKLVDEVKHQEYTGVKSRLIWDNVKKISQLGLPIWIRIPIIPGYTDDVKNIRALAEIIKELENIERIDLLPYHRLGEAKYKRLGLKYPLEGLEPPSEEEMEEFRKIMDLKNIKLSKAIKTK